jgi:hypothetical protein
MKWLATLLLFSTPLTAKTKVEANAAVLEILLESAGMPLSKLTPVSIEARNVLCTRTKNVSDCSANFMINGVEDLRKIKRSEQFFQLLRSKKAITLDEDLLGSANYRAQKISCSFTSVEKNYYSCSSDVTINF